MYHITTLGRDPHGNPSSQPPFKSGVNQGYRRVEKEGRWIHVLGVGEIPTGSGVTNRFTRLRGCEGVLRVQACVN